MKKIWIALLALVATPALAQLTPQMGRTIDADGHVKNDAAVVVKNGTAVVSSTNPLPIACTDASNVRISCDSGGSGGGGSSVTQGSTTSGQSGSLTLGATTTAAPTYTTGTSNAVSLTTGGALRIDNTTLPPGASTSALQTTGNTSLSSIAGTTATVGSAAPATGQQVTGYDGTNARRLLTDTRGAFTGSQGAVTTTRTTLTAGTAATALETAAVTARVGAGFFVEAALTANVYICSTQTTGCSATAYDFLIPSGAGAGTVYTPIYPSNTRYYAFSSAAQVVVLNSWVAQ